MTASRLASGGSRIDRSRPLAFTFDDRALTGFAGDTVASALLGAGIDIVGRSIYDDRPRGIVSAGTEEPNALVQVRWPGGPSEPMLRATTTPLVDGLAAWSLAGKGRLEPAPDGDPGRFDAMHRHVEVLVVGAGEAGLAAAAAARAEHPGDRVLVLDQDPDAAGEGVVADTTVLGLYDHGFVTAVQRRPTPTTEGRTWRIRARRIVLATGATERPIVFADDDRPRIMLASAAAAYVEWFGVAPGRRAVIFTTNDTTASVATTLTAAGIELVETVDARRGDVVFDTLADGDGRLASVRIGRLDAAGGIDPSTVRSVEADLLAVSGGWNPNVGLWSHTRGTLRFDDAIAAFVPDVAPVNVPIEVVGGAAGRIDGLGDIAPRWLVPPVDPSADGAWRHHYVDLGRDATVVSLQRALGAGLDSIEHLKRYTTIGTGADQGKTSGVVTSAIAAAILGQDVGAVGVPTYRPPTSPVSFAQLGGSRPRRPGRPDPGDLHPPLARGAWRGLRGRGPVEAAVVLPAGRGADGRGRPARVPRRPDRGRRDGCDDPRQDRPPGPGRGHLPGSRLHEHCSPRLKVGSCRYGLMCKADGMVFDDGVTARIADDRFLMTTTTGNAAAVLDHLEEWLQTEWPALRVHATSVTEQWATVAVVGPRSREVVAALCPDLDVSVEAFPFMTWREAVIAGAPGRVFRISFSGELAYELNVPTWYRRVAVGCGDGRRRRRWASRRTARRPSTCCAPRRATRSSARRPTAPSRPTTWAWACSRRRRRTGSGRRSQRRPDTQRPDRKQLVGLLPVDPDIRLPEGAQLVAAGTDLATKPVPMLGHVTSSYRSAALGRTFALALLKGGRGRIGEHVLAPLLDGSVVEAEVTGSVLFDPDNTRRDGEPVR